MTWMMEQLLQLVPDAASARSARALALPRRWQDLGSDGGAVWGRCQGSAQEPYRTVVDLGGQAFACTCSSAKTPCKHLLGLVLLCATEPTSFAQVEPPAWAAEWLLVRRERAQKHAVARKEPLDLERAAAEHEKRARRREERISAGVDDLDRWLQDLVHVGLAEAAARPWSSYEQMAARLVDAQAPGLARFVRELGGLPHTAPNWPERMLIELGQLALLLEAWRQREVLDADLRAEVRAQVGINESRDDVLASPAIHDVWDVVGRRTIDGERMRVQRTWLWGQHTHRWAVLLDFAVGGQAIEQRVATGGTFEADLCFYSGTVRLRAIPIAPPTRVGSVTHLPGQSIDAALRAYAEMLARNPWLERAPIALRSVVPRHASDQSWWIVGDDGQQLPLAGATGWHLAALSGGHAIDLLGEWNGFAIWPLAALTEGRLAPLRELAAA
jgi:hypothetical protein